MEYLSLILMKFFIVQTTNNDAVYFPKTHNFRGKIHF